MASKTSLRIVVLGSGGEAGETAERIAGSLVAGTQEPDATVERLHEGADDVELWIGREDLVLVASGVCVAPGWLPRLVAAAHSDSTVATASAMVAGGTAAPPEATAQPIERSAAAVADCSEHLRPRLVAPLPGCVLLRRPALDLAGRSGGGSGPVRIDALEELGARCSELGLVHLLADDVLVAGPSGPSATHVPERPRERRPWLRLAPEIDGDPTGPVRRAVLAASRGLAPLTLTIDGRGLTARRAGTQVHALELIAGLGRTGEVDLRIVTPPDLDPDAERLFASIDGLTTLPYERAAGEGVPRTQVVHRPSQVFTAADLALLVPLGERLVISHQDLIAYRSPAYHGTPDDWLAFRRTTRTAMAAADHVVFFTAHAMADALAEDLIEASRGSVTPIGVDHHVARSTGPASRPPALKSAAPFLLCLGADLPHKNHRFAATLLDRLRCDDGWDGRLVHAGPAATPGGAGGLEGAEDVQILGPVTESEKAWLLTHAAAVVYPTVYEGFGLVPFEAGEHGVPCLFAPQASLAEVLPSEIAMLVPWNAELSARACRPLLSDGPARQEHVAALKRAAERFRWDTTAQATVATYRRVLAQPFREERRGPRARVALEERLEETLRLREREWKRFAAFRDEIGSDGLGLVGPGGILEPADQRALLALASRGSLYRPLSATLRAAYSLARRLRAG